ncbi:MAG: hypothetical protein ACYDHH_27200 [Solirubrobacteraceae bacterium]
MKLCIYPGCERPAVPPHPLGGPQPSFCELEEHNALTVHQERQRLAGLVAGPAAPAKASNEQEVDNG